jgi:hypothetical protein
VTRASRALTTTVFTVLTIWALISVGRAAALYVRQAANERAAIASMRQIVRAQAAFFGECGQQHYSTTLMDLGTPPPTRRDGYLSSRRGELGWSLTAPVRGYLFTLQRGRGAAAGPPDCNAFSTQTTYYAVAVPFRLGVDGRRTFAANQEGVIWEHEGLPPPREPFGPPARPTR